MEVATHGTDMPASAARPRVGGLALVALWAAVLAAGSALVVEWETKPGAGADAPERWPGASSIARREGTPLLVVFLHPRCPCSAATLAELDRLLISCPGRADARVVLVAPDGAPAGWDDTPLRARAAEIARVSPELTVARDDAARETRRFGARTSGEAMLFDRAGRLVFRGGITGSRGHEGANAGSDAVRALLEGRAPGAAATPVFGCPLLGGGESGS